jgi:hypothetical protein
MGDDQAELRHTHIRVLAGTASSGRPVYEVLPAALTEDNDYEILGSLALAYGFAAGDRLRVADDSTYEVLRRGGNLCIRSYPATAPSEADVAALMTEFEPLSGLVEMPPDRRFVVITVPMTAGFPAVEAAVDGWATARAWDWEYGNTYDEQGNALGWWDNE